MWYGLAFPLAGEIYRAHRCAHIPADAVTIHSGSAAQLDLLAHGLDSHFPARTVTVHRAAAEVQWDRSGRLAVPAATVYCPPLRTRR